MSRFARLFSLFCPDSFQQLHISRKHFFAGFGHDAHSGGEKTGQWRFQVKESKEKEKEHGIFQFVTEVFQGTGFLGLDGIDTDVQHSGYFCARVARQCADKRHGALPLPQHGRSARQEVPLFQRALSSIYGNVSGACGGNTCCYYRLPGKGRQSIPGQ